MEIINVLMNTDPANLAIGVFGVFALIGMAGGEAQEEDDNSDYDNASWNPASVNYNE
jgi:hypothetical protein